MVIISTDFRHDRKIIKSHMSSFRTMPALSRNWNLSIKQGRIVHRSGRENKKCWHTKRVYYEKNNVKDFIFFIYKSVKCIICKVTYNKYDNQYIHTTIHTVSQKWIIEELPLLKRHPKLSIAIESVVFATSISYLYLLSLWYFLPVQYKLSISIESIVFATTLNYL